MGVWKPRQLFQQSDVATAEANLCRSRCAPLFFHQVDAQHRSQQDSCSLCTQPVKPLASVLIQQRPLEQQQLARAAASTPPPRRPPRHPYPMAASGAGHQRCRVPGALLAAPRRNGSSAAPWRRQSAGLGSPRRRLAAAEPSVAARALGNASRGPGSHGRRPRQTPAGSGSGPRAGGSGDSGGRRVPSCGRTGRR